MLDNIIQSIKSEIKLVEPVEEVSPVEDVPEISEVSENTLFEQLVKEAGIDLTQEESKTLKSTLDNVTRSYLGAVRICNPRNCGQLSICPFTKINKYPVDKPCSMEVLIANQAADDYYRLLGEELGGTNFNIIEINTINSLVQMEIEDFRLRTNLASSGSIINQPLFVDHKTGEVHYQSVENPAYNAMERIGRRKDKLMQRLLLTPEAKARFRVKSSKDRKDRQMEALRRAEDKIQQLKLETQHSIST